MLRQALAGYDRTTRTMRLYIIAIAHRSGYHSRLGIEDDRAPGVPSAKQVGSQISLGLFIPSAHGSITRISSPTIGFPSYDNE